MADERGKEGLNEAVAEHVRRLRQRLADGRSEIERQRAVVDATRDHIDEMRRWLESGGETA
jgi:hypothetical protein